ncbi:hypothetical protein AbraIFM66951_009325 [Aspergillus brasiliensis]|nr:hypothetical protein AbraIFM66950_003978 [Aspergillus brasiliensis]GKZ46392.1 hypothetical protein AbraIFM66951_009325 [Aspergillus brasiliensis]
MDVALVYEGSTNTDRLNFIMTSPSQKPRNHSASTPEARGWEHQPPHTTSTMSSTSSNPVSRFAEAAKEKIAPSTSSKAKDPTENWTPEEMFETTLDRNGNPVPNADSFIDGDKMTQRRQGPDEGDLFEAANEDFD